MRSVLSPWDNDELLRAELFSVERLEQHAASLATAQEIAKRPVRRQALGARLVQNEAVLLSAYRAIATAVSEGRSVTPAAEWLLDNYHLVEEQIREIREDLPPGFYKQLPKLASGPLAGYPRVFGIAWAFVAHTDSHFDPEMLRRFVRAYQTVQPLTIGELWAIAITLRIVLVENIRRAAHRIVRSRADRQEADALADRLLGVNGQDADPQILAGRDDDVISLSPAFVVQLLQRLRDLDPHVTPALQWLDRVLAARGLSADEIVRDEHQRQGASNVTVRNVITSMRLISDVDWAEFFEGVSLVDETLRAESDFASMDFGTRNLYRTAIEELGRGSPLSEIDIARKALVPANDSEAAAPQSRDPGWRLIGEGRREFEKAIGYRVTFWKWPGRLNLTVGAGDYVAAILLLGALILCFPLLALEAHGIPRAMLPLFALLGFIPAIDAAVALVNRAVARGFGASTLPGLALRDGVPTSLRTLVAVPTLLTTLKAVEEQIERLEVHYLASPEGDLCFALLSDWADAATEHAPGDEEILAAAAAGIARLNAIHGPAAASDRFLLLHRRRLWSEDQRQWIGWERKRGKLHELNRLLRGASDTTFVSIAGVAPAVPPDVRYVITLDADTKLPRDAARRLVGKMAHPLNRPQFDAERGRVVDGYAVLQPRVTHSLSVGGEASLFTRTFAGASGIDPYAAAVSDVYQDLLGEGSYAGKGIYDVDAFEAALAGRVPEGAMLSHDLFEGIFARAGLATDIEVVEEFPARYDLAAVRQHRWARGDWQLLPWLLGRRTADGDRRRSSIPLIGRWKIVDNLRRTLSAPACVIALATGCFLSLSAAMSWTAFIVLSIALPTLLPVLAALFPARARITARSHLRAFVRDLSLAARQSVLLLTFLAHHTWLMTDAIMRTLFRLIVTRRQLLEWVTAAQVTSNAGYSATTLFYRMAGGVAIGLGMLAIVAWSATDARWIALPFALLWIASPGIAYWISRSPRVAGRLQLSESDAVALRLVARRTWRFFETFVTADDQMLPPDNFQEDPNPVLARRTSPTNIGLYLLSTVSARDLGWAGTCDTVERLESTLETMSRMQRFRGHFFNWYATADLRPLDPRYVSSVDSGNLAAHLIALANACEEWIGAAPHPKSVRTGIEDALALAREALRDLPQDLRAQGVARRQVTAALTEIEAGLQLTDESARWAALAQRSATATDLVRTMTSDLIDVAQTDLLFWIEAIQRTIESQRRDLSLSSDGVQAFQQRLAAIADTARTTAAAMDFGFLLDQERRLLSIGYRATDGTLDPSCYDLLASEARLASFFGIAKSDIPARHWFRLGRPVTSIGFGAALISWSGSMFEYLMPSLVMRAPTGSLLEQTSRLIVRRQIAYGEELGVPWGISESAYNARDLELTYQYSNFGVPGLGLKRGLSENAVIAPYATALAAMVDPRSAVSNFSALTAVGALGRHGYYEALDYTRARVPEDSDVAIVRAYMAHHQGMSIVAIANVLTDGRMRGRFHAEPIIRATELLLQERTPRDVSLAHPRAEEVDTASRIADVQLPDVRRLTTVHDVTPQAHVLSNGRYSVMVTAAGSGYSRWRDLDVTRWREDSTRDDSGSYIYLRDMQSGEVWSAGYQPIGREADQYQVSFSEDRAEFIRSDGAFTTTLEVVVSPEDDAEVRRLSVVNTSGRVKDIEITSYAEIVLAPAAADLAHPAFSKLFVQTEHVAGLNALLATRRRRSPTEPEIWAAHHAVVEGKVLGKPEIETDRLRFIGRGRELRSPIVVMDGRRLSNSAGTVLDSVFALRYRLRIAAGATARIAFWTDVASSRDGVLDLLDKHNDPNAFVRATTLAWTQAQVQLRHIGVDAAEASLFQRLAGHILYADAAMRPSSERIRSGGGAPPALWSQGISGDIPIVVVRIDAVDDMAIARQLLRAHEYWRMKHLAVDLVILNERGSSYVQDLQIALETQLRMSQSRPQIGGDGLRGSVYMLRSDLISPETRAVLLSVARVVLVGQRGTLGDQLDRLPAPAADALPTPSVAEVIIDAPTVTALPDLEFFNGLGGFADDGREYVTLLSADQATPAPWINVIANERFGFQVAVEGGGYTWSVSSKENQLTPWSNDPVIDRPGEVIYVRDDETGELWGPTASPIRDLRARYSARHGQGYSRFEHATRGIALDLLLYVPLTDSIKICRLKLTNHSPRTRRLSVAAYAEWVLGPSRTTGAPHLVTELDPQTGAMFVRNPWNATFGSRVAFGDLGGRQESWTADRREFLGRHGTLDRPAALLKESPLSGRVGAGFDSCCALQRSIEVEPGSTTEVVFLLGEGKDAAEARSLVTRYRSADLDAVFQSVVAYWDDVLGTVQVKTPDRSMDIVLNRWALYQTLACRVWARSAFYQASGAYGFRDQLQDTLALTTATPKFTREHLLRAAGRQFLEGDVQHWWLPPTGQGVRTRISDDRVWLAYCAAQYIERTGDLAVLEEQVPFIEGQALRPDEHDAYFLPSTSDETASLYEHCARALDHSLAVGVHGLPLIGTGDWNDGMNRVGEHGRGESIWLGWFLHTALGAFSTLAQARGDRKRSSHWRKHAAILQGALEREGWDGNWYRRGYFDDGTPLGSASSEECRIDSIAQSWSVISGAADSVRAEQAMAAVDSQLIQRNTALALLFTPPFDRTPLEPGYVKGYPPGIRENGGQYTHAAAWSVVAFAMLGKGDKAAELFSILNPINRTTSRAGVHRYKVEPYVIAADIYSVAPHAGRGGWTWYTGSAGWLYRAGLESILGFKPRGNQLKLDPCIPSQWPSFEITYRYRTARYEIRVENPNGVSRGVARAELDGQPLAPGTTVVDLVDDGRTHVVRVTLGSEQLPPV